MPRLATAWLVCALLLCASSVLRAETGHNDGEMDKIEVTAEQAEQRSGWVGLPGITYSPDQGLSLSGAVLHYFRFPGGTRPSRLRLSGSVSLRGYGSVDLDPDLWFFEDKVNLAITSKLSNLDRRYFGVGNYSKAEDEELYRTNRLDFRTELARRLPRNWFIAAIYDFRYQKITESPAGGTIRGGDVVGAGETYLSALGVELRLDTRDRTFSPTSGIRMESSPRFYLKALGSTHQLMRWFTDFSFFYSLGGQHVLAFDSRLDIRFGDIPFDFYSETGGKRIMRGLLQGRFRDKHHAAAQVEYRFPIYWRVGGVAFVGAGRVSDELSTLITDGPVAYRGSVGGGLRFAFDQKEGINLRFDFAYADGETGAYLNLLEAF